MRLTNQTTELKIGLEKQSVSRYFVLYIIFFMNINDETSAKITTNLIPTDTLCNTRQTLKNTYEFIHLQNTLLFKFCAN